MNNTTTKGNLTIVAVFMAATLVVGTFAVTTTTQTAFAFSKNKKGDENSKNGNTITALKCQNKGSASGFDTALDQECENLICTNPGNNATCVQEGAVAAAVQQGSQTTPVKLTCEECFRKFLNADQITGILRFFPVNSLQGLCDLLSSAPAGDLAEIEAFLIRVLGETVAAQLIQCLIDAGIAFPTDTDSVRTLR
jgi:hypothetical protein